ncbi:glutathione S-transferase family protein [Neorhizobium petrolearium]|uniref:Glutathione S-transferase family protein n=1 Tax=Neorhizobium petrolearium TaxID=515361 RepID=A0ABY8LZ77_9HYPH|nr:glutathione S-transferase family protein [Neorhizobium petrolearium]MCC2612494.1 glutathione S-transferase family protein [Neorhizobium petrolearium]WGI67622.1 glutathione S-transferase family protein [Neorhizobium petrolearium]
MGKLTLYIGNKNYSSWSLRPWIAMTAAGIDFQEVLIPFDFPAGNPKFKPISPTGRVPVLHHGNIRVWESLSIIEYVAELFPEKGIWPKAAADRAVARSISMEMLSGFRALRNACPMNMRRPKRKLDLPEGVMDDVTRIETIWRELRAKSGGPFLFGAFTGADAMFAPVVNRFDVYDLVTDAGTLAYMAAMKSHPAWIKWQEAALAESWIVPEDEA